MEIRRAIHQQRKKHVEALIERLRDYPAGGTYPLDPYEREILLERLDGQSGRGPLK